MLPSNINLSAIEEFAELKERYEFLSIQRKDMEDAKETLSKLIDDMEVLMTKQFREQLAKIDVKEIGALGAEFDPELHNAVNRVEDENYGENVVCQVFQKGYTIKDKALRCAMVVVANP